MSYLVIYCTLGNIPLPKLDQEALLYQAFASYDYSDPINLQSFIQNEHLLHVR